MDGRCRDIELDGLTDWGIKMAVVGVNPYRVENIFENFNSIVYGPLPGAELWKWILHCGVKDDNVVKVLKP